MIARPSHKQLSACYRAALNAGRSSRVKGVRLSVCPSNEWIVTKQKKNLSRFLLAYRTKDHLA